MSIALGAKGKFTCNQEQQVGKGKKPLQNNIGVQNRGSTMVLTKHILYKLSWYKEYDVCKAVQIH